MPSGLSFGPGRDSVAANDRTTLYIVERDAESRRAIRELLTTTRHEVETFSESMALVEAVDPDRPGCIVSEMYLSDRTGVELCGDLQAMGCELPVIVTTTHADTEFAISAIKCGVYDLIVKPLAPTRLLDAVHRAVTHSQQHIGHARARRQLTDRYQSLTQREREVLRDVIDGLPNKQIAIHLSLSQRTVETHRNRVMQKLGASSVAELVRMAVIIDPRVFHPYALAV